MDLRHSNFIPLTYIKLNYFRCVIRETQWIFRTKAFQLLYPGSVSGQDYNFEYIRTIILNICSLLGLLI